MLKTPLSLLLLLPSFVVAQSSNKPKSHRFSFYTGYGAAGSFFVRSYDEYQTSFEVAFYKKHFLGTNINFGIGYSTSKNSELSLRYTRQQFSRRVTYNDTFTTGGLIYLDTDI